MKILSFFSVGILFGIILSKSEAISWFRIHEMFRFESFHMYGIIGTAVALGAAIIWAMKRFKMKTIEGNLVTYNPMPYNLKRHLLAGSIFGLGWGLVGCCPGPMYILIGQGYWIIALVLLSAVIGTFTYGAVKDKLPH
ncbi:MAG: YeeE/YedE family protein [Saprospiraceae bacterium]|nr:YeeE/YedE family protein [Saprospiraceae bacterium]